MSTILEQGNIGKNKDLPKEQDKPKDKPKDDLPKKCYQVWLIFPNGESKQVKANEHDCNTREEGRIVRVHLEELLDSDSYIRAPSGGCFQSRTVRVELREVKG